MNELNDKARAARNAYAREWRAKNPEKVRAANKRYWMRRAETAKTEEKNKDERRCNYG